MELVALLTTYPKVVSLVVIDAVVCWVISYEYIHIYIHISMYVIIARVFPCIRSQFLRVPFYNSFLQCAAYFIFTSKFWVLFDEERD